MGLLFSVPQQTVCFLLRLSPTWTTETSSTLAFLSHTSVLSSLHKTQLPKEWICSFCQTMWWSYSDPFTGIPFPSVSSTLHVLIFKAIWDVYSSLLLVFFSILFQLFSSFTNLKQLHPNSMGPFAYSQLKSIYIYMHFPYFSPTTLVSSSAVPPQSILNCKFTGNRDQSILLM